MEAVSCLLVSRKEETVGGTRAAISRASSSVMTPGPEGISETRPSASAPYRTASAASSWLPMQQIFTLSFTRQILPAIPARRLPVRRETCGAGRDSIRGVRRVLTTDLFLPLQRELVSLLRSLDDSDWLRPTVARGWAVKDVAAHLLDTDLRRLSMQRDGYRPRSPAKDLRNYDGLVKFLNELNAAWVGAAERLSPRVIIDLLEWSGPQVAELFASLAPDDPAPVSVAWAGEDSSANWMDVGREYTEKWHHQAQIRGAVGAAPLDGRRWLAPVLELSMYALPYAFRDVGAKDGDALAVAIGGEAGGVWHIIKRGNGWELREGNAAEAGARVRLDADTAWRLFFNALRGDEAARRVAAEGDERLCAAFLNVRSVMV